MATAFTSLATNSALSIVQAAARRARQSAPSTLNSTSRDVISWLACLTEAGKETRRKFLWPILLKRYTFTTTTATDYELPPDFDRSVFDTFWKQSEYRPMLGPLTAIAWEREVSGVVSSNAYLKFRFFGAQSNRFRLTEAPGVGETVAFQFQSGNWILPSEDWSAGKSVTSGEYLAYEGNVYKAASSGTTGATAPTHMIGSVTDGTITWEAVAYASVIEDGARPLLDPEILTLRTMSIWLRNNGFDYQSVEDAYYSEMNKMIAGLTGAQIVVLGVQQNGPELITDDILPTTGWG